MVNDKGWNLKPEDLDLLTKLVRLEKEHAARRPPHPREPGAPEDWYEAHRLWHGWTGASPSEHGVRVAALYVSDYDAAVRKQVGRSLRRLEALDMVELMTRGGPNVVAVKLTVFGRVYAGEQAKPKRAGAART